MKFYCSTLSSNSVTLKQVLKADFLRFSFTYGGVI